MTHRTKLILAALSAALILSMGVSVASALRSLSVEGETTISANGIFTWIGREGGLTLRCPMTITGTVSRAIPKVNGILSGRLTRLATNRPEANCSMSLGTLQGIIILAPEPREEAGSTKCRFFQESFTGTLPRITSIWTIAKGCLIGFETRVEILGTIRCLYKEDGGGIETKKDLNAEERLTTVELGRNRSLLLEGQNGFCPREGELLGRFTTSNGPTIRLI
jgi:hypothetical protein